ncbi:lipopolysaccharide transport periplasmic protein LptA [Blochmannia endosymbiont of Colobopsis nipponica]|uniref:lipopolysaccharide transport periplasmic protein LptA n=1 Tax=Blochmannia endosymbiont of Colobopsis nipponica TaxID=2681987 RepID=UPI0017845DAA|nr:lipopolysaccharide transport periplasmic protein LptA [Blochmannia endosymbiont of Colobopsis nipponica]QOI10806.1 lipopolysaccharide transport periplasmic protein LptA [Blochmannia endosymbiont of Colobopsis nipponica]
MILVLITISTKCISLNKEDKKIILINSNKQSINMTDNSLTFTGKVAIHYNFINIQADFVKISYQQGKNKYKIIEGYGNPITFKKLKKNNELITGQCLKFHYETNDNKILLIGKAYIKKSNNYIQADYINYLINKNRIQAYSDNGKQVITKIILHS